MFPHASEFPYCMISIGLFPPVAFHHFNLHCVVMTPKLNCTTCIPTAVFYPSCKLVIQPGKFQQCFQHMNKRCKSLQESVLLILPCFRNWWLFPVVVVVVVVVVVLFSWWPNMAHLFLWRVLAQHTGEFPWPMVGGKHGPTLQGKSPVHGTYCKVGLLKPLKQLARLRAFYCFFSAQSPHIPSSRLPR